MQDAYELVRTHIGEAAVRNKRYYDVRVRPATYQVGQWVYYFNPRRYKGRQDKWSRKYTGPFCVVRVLGPVNVELQQAKRSRPFIVHIDKVKPYLGDPPKGWVTNTDVEVVEFNPNDIEPDYQPTNSFIEPCENVSPAVHVTPELVDVVTFNPDQEFRRSRPRRQVQLPARLRD
jgi:hypothetical protein